MAARVAPGAKTLSACAVTGLQLDGVNTPTSAIRSTTCAVVFGRSVTVAAGTEWLRPAALPA